MVRLVMWQTDQFPKTDELPEPYRDALSGMKAEFGSYDLKLGYNGRHQTYGWAVLLPQ